MAEPADLRNLREKFGVDTVDIPPPIYNSVKSVEGNRNAVGCHNQVNRGEVYMKDTTTEGDVPVDKPECIANEAQNKVSSSGGSRGKLIKWELGWAWIMGLVELKTWMCWAKKLIAA